MPGTVTLSHQPATRRPRWWQRTAREDRRVDAFLLAIRATDPDALTTPIPATRPQGWRAGRTDTTPLPRVIVTAAAAL